MIGLYVHIPFCIQKCNYCNFVIALSGNPRLRADYFRALAAEILEARRKYGAITFDTVYLGGGTPSALSVAEMEELFALLKANFSWKEDAEITCEVNPGEVDAEKLEHYRRHGVNRISLGVQSVNDALLKDMNRAHNADQARQTALLAREIGFENISMDLILRLPGQTIEDARVAAEKVVEWGARQVVVYDLAVHNETVFGLRRRRGQLVLPPEEEHARMFAAVESVLGGAGFDHYEISSFAKPGFESRHNLIYWHNQPYLGLGPGAFSYMDGVRYVYAKTVHQYLQKALRGDWTREESDLLSAEDREMETLLTGLRLTAGVEMIRMPSIREHVAAEARVLAAQGLVEYDGRVLRMTRRGRYVAENVFIRLSRAN